MSAMPEVRISGYACVFRRPDMVGDVALPGAFTESLAKRGADAIYMLWQHEAKTPIGQWDDIHEDDKGLFVQGRLSSTSEQALKAATMIRAKAIDGLSIGFKAQREETDPRTGERLLRQIKLVEVSLVTFPMQSEARICGIAQDFEGGKLMERLDE